MWNVQPFKRRRLNTSRIKKSILHDKQDINQCNSIISSLQSSLNGPLEILTEIALYATGLILKCQNNSCDGQVHYLRSDNFNDNNQYDNPWNLYNYKCDNKDCNFEFHVFDCTQCANIIKIGISIYVFPNHVCQSVSKCGSIYCHFNNCWQNNLISCNCCLQEYCENCANNNNNNNGNFYCKNCSNCHNKLILY